MAYVRRKGNQLAIVHGARDAATKQVHQETLFSIYSKAEAMAALGSEQPRFRALLEAQAPGIRLDWAKIEAGIRAHLEHLPDLYRYRDERIEGGFRSALRALARELVLADPQLLYSAAQTLNEHRYELAYLRDLIDGRLELAEDAAPDEWNQDNPFYWRSRAHRGQVPPSEWEKLDELYARGDYDQAEAVAKLLTECWPNFARGFNYLGLIAIERDRLDEALSYFDEAMRTGRTSLPKRISKDSYWADHDTRPYIRAIIYKANTLNQMDRCDEALALCDRLERECAQDVAAAIERATIHLNRGDWPQALTAARSASQIAPHLNFVIAFVQYEAGEEHEALVHFLHAAISRPRTARMLAGARTRRKPKTREAREDHEDGVRLRRALTPYLRRRGSAARAFFARLVHEPRVAATIEEAQEVQRRHAHDRRADRAVYDRMMQMRSLAFARAQAEALAPAIVEPKGSRGPRRRPGAGPG